SVVKRVIADGSVGSPHVRVGHRQALNTKKGLSKRVTPFFMQKTLSTAAGSQFFRIADKIQQIFI
ncbi:MAG: hypothetical protein ACK4L8_15245, partial [Nitrincola lacisaponensis]|uniref:hypothetical protein n=1 Tax=Nitrincola lacisaponensis TaxID=267850 RepID=UPI00391AB37D